MTSGGPLDLVSKKIVLFLQVYRAMVPPPKSTRVRTGIEQCALNACMHVRARCVCRLALPWYWLAVGFCDVVVVVQHVADARTCADVPTNSRISRVSYQENK